MKKRLTANKLLSILAISATTFICTAYWCMLALLDSLFLHDRYFVIKDASHVGWTPAIESRWHEIMDAEAEFLAEHWIYAWTIDCPVWGQFLVAIAMVVLMLLSWAVFRHYFKILKIRVDANN